MEKILEILIALLSFSGNSRTSGNSLDRKKVVSILEEDEDASSTPEKKSSPADAVVSVVAVSSDPVKGGERPSRSGHYCNFLLSLVKTRLPLGAIHEIDPSLLGPILSSLVCYKKLALCTWSQLTQCVSI